VNRLVAFLCGGLFAAGVCISGMVRPSKVLAFLDLGGAWDASLLLVMAAALSLHVIAWRVTKARTTPPLGAAYPAPPSPVVDRRLVGGAALFGIGWGISGYCPGPAMIATLSGATSSIVFLACVALAMVLHERRTQSSSDG